MRGDFSRRTFRRNRHYSRVLLQQGRVVLDADWNEQAEIQLRAMRTMMRDLVGPHGGPEDALGFRIEIEVNGDKLDLTVTNGLDANETPPKDGRYYVDGIMVQHTLEGESLVLKNIAKPELDEGLLVYLEVWERHVTWIEENKSFQQRTMREVALGGPDTASRSEVRWKVQTTTPSSSLAVGGSGTLDDANLSTSISQVLATLVAPKGTLAASLSSADIGEGDPCRDTAEARYRGLENRLYRVEIHETDALIDGKTYQTFKWSRENGSVVYPIVLGSGQPETGSGDLVVDVTGLGRDDRYHLRRGNIVELVTDRIDEDGKAGPLYEVKEVEEIDSRVTLHPLGKTDGSELKGAVWALLRRWDQSLKSQREKGEVKMSRGAIAIDGPDGFVLEDGIVVSFAPVELDPNAGLEQDPTYGFQAGDYWLIPARTIPADIEWPRDEKSKASSAEQPHGVERHYAPLAVVSVSDGGTSVEDLRMKVEKLGKPVPA